MNILVHVSISIFPKQNGLNLWVGLPPRPPDYDDYWYQADDGYWYNEYDDLGYEFADPEQDGEQQVL